MNHKIISESKYPNWFSTWVSQFDGWPFHDYTLYSVMPDKAYQEIARRVAPQDSGRLFGTAYTYLTNGHKNGLEMVDLVIESLVSGRFNDQGVQFFPDKPRRVLIIGPGKGGDEIELVLKKVPRITEVVVIEADPSGSIYSDGKFENPNQIPVKLILGDIMWFLADEKAHTPFLGAFDLILDRHVFDGDYFKPDQLAFINEGLAKLAAPNSVELSIFHGGPARFRNADNSIYTQYLAAQAGLEDRFAYFGGQVLLHPGE